MIEGIGNTLCQMIVAHSAMFCDSLTDLNPCDFFIKSMAFRKEWDAREMRVHRARKLYMRVCSLLGHEIMLSIEVTRRLTADNMP